MWGRIALALLVVAACSRKNKTEPAPRTDAAVAIQGDLEFRGTPTIPDHLADDIDRYTDNTNASIVSYSEDDDTLLLRFGRRFARMKSSEGELEVIHQAPRSVRVSMMSRGRLVYAQGGGRERYEIVVHDLQSGETKTIPGIEMATGLRLADNGRVMFVGDKAGGTRFAIRQFDEPYESSKVVFEGDGITYPACASSSGRHLVVARLVASMHYHMVALDLDSGNKRWLQSGDTKQSFGGCSFADDGKTLYAVGNRGGEFDRLHRVDIAANRWTPLTSDIPWDIESFSLSSKGLLAFAANDNGSSRLYLQHPKSGKRERIVLDTGGVIHNLSFSGDHLKLSIQPATGQRRFYVYSLAVRYPIRFGGRWKDRLGELPLIETKPISYNSFDGRTIHGLYYKPLGDGPFPVVIDAHGGPASQWRPVYHSLHQMIADRGIAVIAPNIRGSTGYGRSFERLDDGPLRGDAIRDIGALLDWIAASEQLDSSRVCVHGDSYGGFVALASLVEFGDRLRCGISNVGVANLLKSRADDDAFRDEAGRGEYGDERDPKVRAFLTKLSPLSNADRIRSPVLLTHGALDPRVPIADAKSMATALRRAGREVWTLWANKDGHSLAGTDTRKAQRSLVLLFLDKHLLERSP